MWSPDGEGPTVHVFHSQLIILGLFSQRSNPLLNVSVRHAFNISEDRDHQALKKEKYNYYIDPFLSKYQKFDPKHKYQTIHEKKLYKLFFEIDFGKNSLYLLNDYLWNNMINQNYLLINNEGDSIYTSLCL